MTSAFFMPSQLSIMLFNAHAGVLDAVNPDRFAFSHRVGKMSEEHVKRMQRAMQRPQMALVS